MFVSLQMTIETSVVHSGSISVHAQHSTGSREQEMGVRITRSFINCPKSSTIASSSHDGINNEDNQTRKVVTSIPLFSQTTRWIFFRVTPTSHLAKIEILGFLCVCAHTRGPRKKKRPPNHRHDKKKMVPAPWNKTRTHPASGAPSGT